MDRLPRDVTGIGAAEKPKRYNTLATIALTAAGSAMPAAYSSAWPPALRISRTTLSPSPMELRVFTATATPAAARLS
jgi:hypothetical protein